MVMSRSCSATSRWISEMGIFFASEKVKCRSRIGVLKVRVSMSSDPAAYTLPARASSAHCASASPGACSMSATLSMPVARYTLP